MQIPSHIYMKYTYTPPLTNNKYDAPTNTVIIWSSRDAWTSGVLNSLFFLYRLKTPLKRAYTNWIEAGIPIHSSVGTQKIKISLFWRLKMLNPYLQQLRHLPPSVAAGLAAERRLKEHVTCSSWAYDKLFDRCAIKQFSGSSQMFSS
jgi:hypothetical protein